MLDYIDMQNSHGNDDDKLAQRVMIITDDVTNTPILDFDQYSETIVNIVRYSHPKFSLGIYGEWGTGKTTLMKVVENKLNDISLKSEHILTVWFNAWRYEREDQFAIIALLKSIAFAMGEHPLYNKVKPILLRAVKIVTKGFLSEVAAKFIGEKGVDEFYKSLLPKFDLLAEVDKDTIYFDGIYKIEREMRNIINSYPSSRVVVFIDDLDRCSPKKALEVLESVKVFLGIDGFVYIMGISHETIAKLISAEYEKSGIKGEQYIKKIIQIPIAIQHWNVDDVKLLVRNLLDGNIIPRKYYEIVEGNLDAIAKAIEPNPREVKRFLNNFIVAYEIHSGNKRIDATCLLILQAISVRWDSFYRILINSTKELRDSIKRCSELTEDERAFVWDPKLGPSQKEGWKTVSLEEESKRVLSNFKSEYELWNFINKNSKAIFEIKEEDWSLYRRATEPPQLFAPSPLYKAVQALRYHVNLLKDDKESTEELIQRCHLFVEEARIGSFLDFDGPRWLKELERNRKSKVKVKQIVDSMLERYDLHIAIENMKEYKAIPKTLVGADNETNETEGEKKHSGSPF